MNSRLQLRGWTFGTGRSTAITGLACAIALGFLAIVFITCPAQGQTYTVLYSFKGGKDGAQPSSALIQDAKGNFYGTTGNGGVGKCRGRKRIVGCGTVFKLSKASGGKWKETVLYSFTGNPDGAGPGTLIRDTAGNLYGSTGGGGSLGAGTVFELDTTGKETVLYSFTGGADGSGPHASTLDAAGDLYGTTWAGGIQNCGDGCGVVFEVDTTGHERVVYSFQSGTDGAWPDGGVMQDTAGNLYGTTSWGGPSAYGTVFKLDTSGQETILHGFSDSPDGRYPWAGLIEDASGNLYGTTVIGGTSWCSEEGSHCGIVFKVDTAGDETILYSFTGGSDGGDSYAGLVQDPNGNLYGTTTFGGSGGGGTIFKLDTSGALTVLHSFNGKDGSGSTAGLIMDAAGNLYGTSPNGGSHKKGLVFKLISQ
jgi:uncharacterized repeat protein (TIGR03803 family)